MVAGRQLRAAAAASSFLRKRPRPGERAGERVLKGRSPGERRARPTPRLRRGRAPGCPGRLGPRSTPHPCSPHPLTPTPRILSAGSARPPRAPPQSPATHTSSNHCFFHSRTEIGAALKNGKQQMQIFFFFLLLTLLTKQKLYLLKEKDSEGERQRGHKVFFHWLAPSNALCTQDWGRPQPGARIAAGSPTECQGPRHLG